MRMVDRPSPNHGERLEQPIDILLLHYTGMKSAAEALDRLCDPASKVSCHWVVDEDGTVYRLVAEQRRAAHAGVSFWAGTRDVNSRSVGIEIVNPGHEWGYGPFPHIQMEAVAELAAGILARHPIPAHRVLGHSDVAPTRKQDPGELFDWAWLAHQGVGLWPEPTALPAAAPGRDPGVDPAAAVARIGYEATPATLPTDLVAFQRHWRPWRVDGALDAETAGRLAAVAALCAAQR